MRSVYRRTKRRALERGYPFELLEQDFIKLSRSPCQYCGVKYSMSFNQKNKKYPYLYNGIDRVDNNRSYVLDNVVPACKACNNAKASMSTEEWANHISRIVTHNLGLSIGELNDPN